MGWGYLKGVNSYHYRVKNPYLGFIDWEYILLHPEAKTAIQERYKTDPFFREKIDEFKAKDVVFKNKFEQYFGSLNKMR